MQADITREVLEFDVLFVGGGPANLSGMIRLLTLARDQGKELEVGLIDKGGSAGAHLLSGAILDPIALKELIPDYLEKGCPLEAPVARDAVFYLGKTQAFPVPFAGQVMNSEGCSIVSISKFSTWLSNQAEELGGNIFPGFSGVEVLFDEATGAVIGVRTGDKGVNKNGDKKSNFEPGIDILARVTVFGEGSKGSLFRELDQRLNLTAGKSPQMYKTAFKEVIKLEEGAVFPKGANVIHAMGYPLESKASGGGFVYRMSQDLVSLGLVIGLDYEDPLFEPHDAFLRFKRHPLIHSLIKGGKVKQQGAKTLPAGGLYSMPKVFFDGGLVVGDSAGVLNTLRLKGIHTAMKSGILAAETILTAFERDDFSADTLQAYSRSLDQSWIKTELLPARNFSQAMARPIVSKLIHLAAQQVSGGRGLVDPMAAHSDHARMKPGRKGKKPAPLNGVRPETDDDLFVDKLTGVFLSGTQHEEDQPCHLIIVRPEICHTQCAQKFDYPCVRFCPGNVYETRQSDTGELTLHLNPSNCLHCKTCEIKDPFNNILWTCPEGGGGPAYTLV